MTRSRQHKKENKSTSDEGSQSFYVVGFLIAVAAYTFGSRVMGAPNNHHLNRPQNGELIFDDCETLDIGHDATRDEKVLTGLKNAKAPVVMRDASATSVGLKELLGAHGDLVVEVARGEDVTNELSDTAYQSTLHAFVTGLRNGSSDAGEYVFTNVDADGPLLERFSRLGDLFALLQCGRHLEFCRWPRLGRGHHHLAVGGQLRD